MRIPRIFQDQSLSPGQRIQLEQSAAHHLCRVLRSRNDDPIILFNGQGGEYHCRLQIDGKQVFAEVQSFDAVDRESSLEITLLQGISKGDRMDFSIQKAVELGVTRIIPVICQRTVVNLKQDRADRKLQHWHGVIINACEQSGRTLVPELSKISKLDTILKHAIEGESLVLDPQADLRIQQLDAEKRRLTLLIGPEGGLSDEEIEYSLQQGFKGIRLGPRILRTETAGLAAIAALQSHYGDF